MFQATKLDFLSVGYSILHQGKWMNAHLAELNVTALIDIDTAFDFLSGNKMQAPPWIQHSGFEWLFRLFSEPTQLWRRYIRYPTFALLAIFQLLGLKNYKD